jgi:4-hydroxybenzoate polyprenyltransferase
LIGWSATTLLVTANLQGTYSLALWVPAWILSLLYPLAKRFIDFPQLILGSACACVLIPSWINGGSGVFRVEELTPMVLFIIF